MPAMSQIPEHFTTELIPNWSHLAQQKLAKVQRVRPRRSRKRKREKLQSTGPDRVPAHHHPRGRNPHHRHSNFQALATSPIRTTLRVYSMNGMRSLRRGRLA